MVKILDFSFPKFRKRLNKPSETRPESTKNFGHGANKRGNTVCIIMINRVLISFCRNKLEKNFFFLSHHYPRYIFINKFNKHYNNKNITK